MRTRDWRDWRAWLPLLALCCLAAVSSPLTKDDVIRMVRAGESENAILDAIRGSRATFDLTADDIAELRKAGASETIVDAMIETGAARPEAERKDTEPTPSVSEEESEAPREEPEPPYDYAVPPPILYPVYPLWYPAYFPVFDPFFPFYGGFFFSFGFVHFSGLHTVFLCDRAVLVVRDHVRLNPRGSPASRAAVFSTPRSAPRGTTARHVTARTSTRDAGRLPPGRVSGVTSSSGASSSRPSRLAGLVARDTAGSRRPRMGPSGVPRVQTSPRSHGPQRFAAPTSRSHRLVPAPRGASAMRGGLRSLAAPRTMGGRHGRPSRH